MTATEIPTAIGETGPCPCGCGQQAPAGRKYADTDRCRQRAYRRRVSAAMEDAHLPARPSLKLAAAARAPQLRLGDGERRPSARQNAVCRDGVQVYFRDPEVAERIRAELLELAKLRDDKDLEQVAVLFQRGLDLRRKRIRDRRARARAAAAEPAAAAVELPRELVVAGELVPCPGCRGSGVCPTCAGDGRVSKDAAA